MESHTTLRSPILPEKRFDAPESFTQGSVHTVPAGIQGAARGRALCIGPAAPTWPEFCSSDSMAQPAPQAA